ncbi:Lar family restriction alleviation protein [Phenylobacterium soli]|uniref:Restriction alleviation protein, Lar family n=1 Tax=Phenylobacterium soli TaxID=2170551 RepID=A0A328AAC0_9CAUL|nr:Lar family restriction alleviation protein [Phenylobacterium soli]RAK51622.1 hypothetical protein DJ017_17455 [Phenylobacterium soli]
MTGAPLLLACPFCGGAAELDTLRPYRNISTGNVERGCAIYCLECSAEHMECYADRRGEDRETVIAEVEERWNRRTTPAGRAALSTTGGGNEE